MLSYKKNAWLIFGVFIFALISNFTIAKAQARLKDPIARELSKKKWKVIDGFRSAKFGMDEKRVLRAIHKDFKIPKTKIKRFLNSRDKTSLLEITIPELLPFGGPSKINYIFGFKSKTLRHVNIFWGKGVAEKVDAQGIVHVANFLSKHFLTHRYIKEKFLTNSRMNNSQILIFRGFDKKKRAVLLVLTSPGTDQVLDAETREQEYMLRLQYFLDPDDPDIFKPKITEIK